MNVTSHSAVHRPASAAALAALLIAALLCSCSTPHRGSEKATRAEPLIEPTTLAEAGAAGQFIVLDARSKKAFTASRLPAARWVDAAKWARVFGDGADAEAWSGRIGELGIDRASKVVVYDDRCFSRAARIRWILLYWGVKDVRLLDGGWQGWTAAELPIERDAPRPPAATTFQATPQPERLTTKEQLLTVLEDKSRQIVDARSAAEFCGIDVRANKRGGHVPTAKHLEWSDLVDKKTQRFKPAAQLKAIFLGAGVDLAKPTVTYCQTGGRAAVVAFAIELLDGEKTSVYHAGWREWSSADDTPVVTERPNHPVLPLAPRNMQR